MKNPISSSLSGAYAQATFLLRSLASYLALAGGAVALIGLGSRLEKSGNLQIPPWELNASPLVMVDAGHGGHDGGAVAGEVLEKNLALHLALLLKAELVARGIRVQMTRETDVFLPLEQRAALADQSGADAFVSVHLNTSAATNVRGIETYYTAHKALSVQRALQLRWSLPSASVQDQRGRWLADSLQKHTCLATAADNRGIKQKNYAVISQTQVPAALIECGFLTHPEELTNLRNEAYQKRLVTGIAAGISGFLKGHLQSPGRGVQTGMPGQQEATAKEGQEAP